jgi:hypothetical protein
MSAIRSFDPLHQALVTSISELHTDKRTEPRWRSLVGLRLATDTPLPSSINR